MRLFEVVLTNTGCSYYRFYAWCQSLDRCQQLAQEKIGDRYSISQIVELMSAQDAEFTTAISDEGWDT